MSAAIGTDAGAVSGRAGINLTVLGLEIRRLLRNRRTVIFALIFPVVLFLFVGTNKTYANLPDGHGNVSAFLVVSMALYGAALATTAGGAMVSIERAQGWSRQLRLTPLSPTTYIIIKTLTAMVLGLASVLAVFIVGQAHRRAAHVRGLLLPVDRSWRRSSGSARWSSPRSGCSSGTCCRRRTSCSSSGW